MEQPLMYTTGRINGSGLEGGMDRIKGSSQGYFECDRSWAEVIATIG